MGGRGPGQEALFWTSLYSGNPVLCSFSLPDPTTCHRAHVCHEVRLRLREGLDLTVLSHRLSRLRRARILLDLELYDSLYGGGGGSIAAAFDAATVELYAGSEWARIRVRGGTRTEVKVTLRPGG